MPDQPPSDRFKAEMPHVPGLAAADSRPATVGGPSAKLVIGLLAVVVVAFLGARWALGPKHASSRAAGQQPQIEVPSPAPDPSTLLPHATPGSPGIAGVEEMAKPWSSKEFLIRSSASGENIPALLIRLPGSASSPASYWAFSLNSPYGDCKLEYVTDLRKLKTDYGFRAAKHPMVVNPCNNTVFDPLKVSNLPGNIFVRGGIAQGSDLRPPLGIEIRVRGKDIEAIRTE